MMTKIALYDLDKTITKRPTYMPFLFHAAWRHEPWRLAFLPGLLFLFAGYALRAIDRGRLKEMMQAMLIGPRVDAAKMAAIAESFAEATLSGNVHPQALAQIAREKAQGDRLVLATASYAFYAEPLARRLGFDDVIGTVIRRGGNDALLARIDGENCYGEAKLRMVEAWATERDVVREATQIRFYSDSETDLPVFDWADDPVATNPNVKLRRIAEKRGWRIISWG